MRPKRAFPVLCLLLLLCMACTRGTLFHHYEHVPEGGWSRSDTLTFPLPQIPHNGTYRICVGMRYACDFPYEGVWIVAETQLSHPMVSRSDTLCLTIADPQGMPTGRGVGLMQRDTLLTMLPLHEGQTGRIRLRHIMAREVLPGICDVGLHITHSPHAQRQ